MTNKPCALLLGLHALERAPLCLAVDEVERVAQQISDDLKSIGITQNFAPVIDASPNEVVSNRSFGLDMDTVIDFSNRFIDVTQSNGIVASVTTRAAFLSKRFTQA